MEKNMTSLIALVHTIAMLTGLVLALICVISVVRIHCEKRSGSRTRKSPSPKMDNSIAPAR
jgi:hypothetical protein